MNIPMMLTLLRFILVPVFILVFILLPEPGLLALIIFVTAAVTDFLDGYLARKWQQESELGAFLDPIADKLLAVTALLILLYYLPSMILLVSSLIIINRELLVSNLRTVMAAEGTTLLVSSLGKWKNSSPIYRNYIIFNLFSNIMENIIALGRVTINIGSYLLSNFYGKLYAKY